MVKGFPNASEFLLLVLGLVSPLCGLLHNLINAAIGSGKEGAERGISAGCFLLLAFGCGGWVMKKILFLVFLFWFLFVGFCFYNVWAYTHDENDLTVQMTGDSSPPPFITTCSPDGTQPAYWAFDHTADVHCWLTFHLPTPSSTQWVGFDFGADGLQVITSYKMTVCDAPCGVSNLNNPRDWHFLGSLNDVDWTILDTHEDVEWQLGETKEFSFSNSQAYRFYRLLVSDANIYTPYPFLAVIELELFGGPPQPTGKFGLVAATAGFLLVFVLIWGTITSI